MNGTEGGLEHVPGMLVVPRAASTGPQSDNYLGAEYLQVQRFPLISAVNSKPKCEDGGPAGSQGPSHQCGRQSGSPTAGDRTGPVGCRTWETTGGSAGG